MFSPPSCNDLYPFIKFVGSSYLRPWGRTTDGRKNWHEYTAESSRVRLQLGQSPSEFEYHSNNLECVANREGYKTNTFKTPSLSLSLSPYLSPSPFPSLSLSPSCLPLPLPHITLRQSWYTTANLRHYIYSCWCPGANWLTTLTWWTLQSNMNIVRSLYINLQPLNKHSSISARG